MSAHSMNWAIYKSISTVLASKGLKFRWGNNINVKQNFRKGDLIKIKRYLFEVGWIAVWETQIQEVLELCSIGLHKWKGGCKMAKNTILQLVIWIFIKNYNWSWQKVTMLVK